MDVGSIIALAISVLALIVPYLSYRVSVNKQFIDAFSAYRIDWMKNLRTHTHSFIVANRSMDIAKMKESKAMIDLYLNFKYEDHVKLSKKLDDCIEANNQDTREMVICFQDTIDRYWRKAKSEAGMTRRISRMHRKRTFNDGKPFD